MMIPFVLNEKTRNNVLNNIFVLRRKRGLSICPIFNAFGGCLTIYKKKTEFHLKKTVDFEILKNKKKHEEGEILKKVSVDEVTKLKIDYCGIWFSTHLVRKRKK